jgi:hypothetical protein
LPSFNTSGIKVNHYLHQFILHEATKEGRKRRLEEQQKEAAERDDNFTALTSYTRMAALLGSLAKHNVFELGAGLLAKVQEKYDIELRKRQNIYMKTEERAKRSSVRFQTAFSKFKTGKVLTRDDLVALINKTKQTTANGKNLRELILQWEDRKNRLHDFINNDNHITIVGTNEILVPVVMEEVPLQFK